jgi:alkylation response protein AidB-like acyl-CoA dehydrogenase
MYTLTAATRAFVYRIAAEADAGRANRKDCAAVILYAAETATRMALDAIQVLCSLSDISNLSKLHVALGEMQRQGSVQERWS